MRRSQKGLWDDGSQSPGKPEPPASSLAGAARRARKRVDDRVVKTARLCGPGRHPQSTDLLRGDDGLRLGLGTVKLFPGSLGGPSYLKSLRGPFPDVSFLATGGAAENVQDWFAAGAFAVGVGGALAPATLEKGSGRERVVGRAQELVNAVRDAVSEA